MSKVKDFLVDIAMFPVAIIGFLMVFILAVSTQSVAEKMNEDN